MTDISSRLANLSPEKRALLARLRQPPAPSKAAASEPLAIIGMGCRLPGGVNSADAFWELLANGIDAISEIPRDRWNIDDYYDPDPLAAGKITTRWGGFLQDVDRFDAAFFGIAPREAAQMDPQQRLLLEVAWQALEHAGQAPDRLAGSRTGVFVGVHSHSNDYCLMQYARPDALDAFSGTGTAHNFLSGRLSYLFDLQGPSLVVDTACSSSLVAVHLACQSLRLGECSMAIVGGVNLMLTPLFHVAASRMHMLAPDGRCKTFDASADGFTRGEGCGVVVVKRLSDAMAAGDRVLAVIRGSAVNQDGHTNGITAPNGLSQESVIREALKNAGAEPQRVGYVEAHGTGTPLGDPIEVEALARALGQPAESGRVVALGSAKSNIGHLEGAAGVAGLIKAVLSLTHRRIPPVVHFKQLNPHISIDGAPFVVPTSLMEWDSDGPRIAGVSSFGWSGTNAHVVLEEAPDADVPNRRVGAGRDYLVPLSASGSEALEALCRAWRDRLTQTGTGGLDLRDFAAAAALRRSPREARLAIVASSVEALADELDAAARAENRPSIVRGTAAGQQPGVVFVFPGQGSQWLGMGRELFATEPAFRETVERCQAALARHVDWSLVDELHADADRSRLHEIDVVQPTLFSVEVALAALWRAWGVQPDAVVGHSMGEVAAAHVAGALTIEDAACIICRRSRLLKRVSGRGAMAVVELSLDEARAAIAGYENHLSIAVSNSPRSTVLSGDVAALGEVLAALQSRDVFCRPIKVDVASHSPQVDPLKPDLLSELASIRPQASSVPIYSTVTTLMTDGAGFDAEYWTRNLREPVLLSKVVQRLAGEGLTTFIEMSPHPVLLPAVETSVQDIGSQALALPSLRREERERAVMLGSLGQLFVAGYPIDWSLQTPGPSAFVELPFTPFQRERFWLPDGDDARPRSRPARGGHPFMGAAVETSGGSFAWEPSTDRPGGSFLEDVQFNGRMMLAPAVSVEAALEAGRTVGLGEIARFELEWPVMADATAEVVLRAESSAMGSDRRRFRMQSRTTNQRWSTHAIAEIGPAPQAVPSEMNVESPRDGALETIAGDEAYERLARGGWQVGRGSRALGDVRIGVDGVSARFELSAAARAGAESFRLPPAIGQACLDAATLAFGANAGTPADEIHLPFRIGGISLGEVRATSGTIAACVVGGAEAASVDVIARDDHGQIVVAFRGIEARHHAPDSRDLVTQRVDDWLFTVAWEAHPLNAAEADPKPGAWVVLADASGVGDALGAVLASRGEAVTTLRREEASELRSVIDEHLKLGGRCRGVVHLWSLDLPALDQIDRPALEAALLANSASVLDVVQTLANGSSGETPRLWIATRGAQRVSRAMAPDGPPQASIWGLGRVIAEEHLEHWGGLVDLDPGADASASAASLLQQIDAEDGERQVAFREGVRYGARYQPWCPSDEDARSRFRFRPNASYLVTGGFGGVGYAAARWMIEEGARHLVLVGRTALPPRSEWSSLDASSSAGRRVAAVRELESLGASIHVAALDVSDGPALEAFWNEFHAEGRPSIRGILHAAVVIEDGLLRELDAASFATVLRPKVSGSWVLHRLAEGASLDFFVLFSSLGSVLGQTGQGNYAAANAFLDALAHYRRDCGLPAISINWGGWREAGLGAASAGARRTIKNLEAEGIASFTTAQGLDVLGRLLQGEAPQVLVMPVSRTRLRRSHWATSDPQLFANLVGVERDVPQASGPDAHPFRTQLLTTDPARRRQVFEHFLAEQLAQVLRLPLSRIDPGRPMGQMGLESLMALELRNRLEARLGLKVSATIVWNHPTVAALARYLADRMEISLEAPAVPLEAADGRQGDPVEPVSDFDALSELDAVRALAGKTDQS